MRRSGKVGTSAGIALACVLAASISVPARATNSDWPWRCGPSSGKLVKVRVFIQSGLDETVAHFSRRVMGVLCGSKGWIQSNKIRYRYDTRGAYVVKLLDPQQTEKRCRELTGLSVNYYYSCASAADKEAVLNSDRWFNGSDHWPGSETDYRDLLVNHEFGHVLGQHHRQCPGKGKPAPVMQQQSKGLNGCTKNPWPLGYEIRSLNP